MNNIKEAFYRHRWSIARIYLYVITGQLLFLVEPYLLGQAIDGLLRGEFKFLLLLLGAFLLESLMVYRRMVFDTKVYVKIYNEIILDYLRRETEASQSARLARTDMANGIVGFVEHDMHYFMSSILTLLGSLYFIFLGSPIAGLAVTLSVIPTLLITKFFYRKVAQAARVGNTHYESKADIIQSGDMKKIEGFYERRKKILVAGSTIQGKHWASLSSTRSAFIILAIVIFTHGKLGLTQGEAVTMYSYISQFLGALLSVPIAVEVITRLKDILGRLSEEKNVQEMVSSGPKVD